jgi:uncharacterized lipoprotein YajG
MRPAVSTFNLLLLIFCYSRPKTSGKTNQQLMKIHYFALLLLAVSGMFFSGCATDTTTTTQTQTDPSNRVYTQDELRKSGETNPAAALEKTDPSVRMSGPR